MARTRIKFCGITRVEDAVTAAEAGADAVGLVLHAESPRRVTRDTARQIIGALSPFVTPVGLFVDAPPQLIVELATDLGLRHIQLHGHEPPSMVASLRAWAIIKAIRVSRDTLGKDVKPWRELSHVRGILFETGSTPQRGGSGVENDWEAIRAAQDRGELSQLPPIIAAGGLRPDNVGAVVRLLRPYAVDVSTGIESAPGIKSAEKMTEFVRAVGDNDS
jgi:phosphoribosylanthranilate isomerase